MTAMKKVLYSIDQTSGTTEAEKLCARTNIGACALSDIPARPEWVKKTLDTSVTSLPGEKLCDVSAEIDLRYYFDNQSSLRLCLYNSEMDSTYNVGQFPAAGNYTSDSLSFGDYKILSTDFRTGTGFYNEMRLIVNGNFYEIKVQYNGTNEAWIKNDS